MLLMLLAAAASPSAPPQPYPLGRTGTPEGARQVVERMFVAADAADDAAYDRVARGLVLMFAPDFGESSTRATFARMLRGCTDRHVNGGRPYAKMPSAQLVRVALRCPVDGSMQDVVADVIADDAHAFAFLPGGIDVVWPERPADK